MKWINSSFTSPTMHTLPSFALSLNCLQLEPLKILKEKVYF